MHHKEARTGYHARVVSKEKAANCGHSCIQIHGQSVASFRSSYLQLSENKQSSCAMIITPSFFHVDFFQKHTGFTSGDASDSSIVWLGCLTNGDVSDSSILCLQANRSIAPAQKAAAGALQTRTKQANRAIPPDCRAARFGRNSPRSHCERG